MTTSLLQPLSRNQNRLAVRSAPKLQIVRERELLAVQHGLPPLDARIIYQHGMEWRVRGHMYVPGLVALARNEGNRTNYAPDSRDLCPVLAPINFSDRLFRLYAQIDRCTSKTLHFVDTMPHLRLSDARPHSYSVDSHSQPDGIVFMCDVAHMHETVLAHELGHLWVEYVDGCEDHRILRDLTDPSRVLQCQHIQSFVLDQKVNRLLERRGFDLSLLTKDYFDALLTLAQILKAGQTPKTAKESAFEALYIASAYLHVQTHGNGKLAGKAFHQAMATIRRNLPREMDLSKKFIASVERHGCDSSAAVRAVVDECLTLAYRYEGKEFEIDKELLEELPAQPNRDKYPQFLPGLPVMTKLEFGRIMAKYDMGVQGEFSYRTSVLNDSYAQVEFQEAGGRWTPPEILRTVPIAPPKPEIVMEPTQPDLPAAPPYDPTDAALAMHRRSYMPGEGVWLSRARLEEQLQGEQPYGYAFNNPIQFLDPTGLWPEHGIASCFNDSGLYCNSHPAPCPQFSHGMTGAWPNVYYDWRPKHCHCPYHSEKSYNNSLSERVECGASITVTKGSCSVTIKIIDVGPNQTPASHAIVDLSPPAARAMWNCLNANKPSNSKRKPHFSCSNFKIFDVTVTG